MAEFGRRIKQYVAVTSSTDEAGAVTPLAIHWPDGRTFEIDRITECVRQASILTGGVGLRYECRIRGKSTFLWYDAPRWFVEARA